MRQPRSEWVWLLTVALNVALLYWWVTRAPPPESREAPAVSEQSASQRSSGPTPPAPLTQTAHGCWLPPLRTVAATVAEQPATDDWRLAGGAGDRLAEDHCGNVWALWFNDWVVFDANNPQRVGRLSLPRSAPYAPLVGAGISAFLPAADGFWAVGRGGQVVRYAQGGWTPMPGLDQPCDPAQLVAHEGRIWLNCSTLNAPTTRRWRSQDNRWEDLGHSPPRPRHLLLSRDRRLLSIGAGEIAEFDTERDSWRARPATMPQPGRRMVADADSDGISVAIDDRLWQFDAEDDPLPSAQLAGKASALRRVPGAGSLVSVAQAGLDHYDGSRWHRWRYAHGLPGSDARDLLIDSRDRLWLAGRPVAVIELAAALRQITRLRDPEPLPGEIYSDACAGVEKLLQRRPHAGQVAQEFGPDGLLVFFDGRQVCPDPWQTDSDTPLYARRRADGALLRTPVNATVRRTRCSTACGEAEQAELARQWRLSLHIPAGPGARAALQARMLDLPDPLPRSSPGPAMLYSSSGDSWVGAGSELYQHDGRRWIVHDFTGNASINAIEEDPYGGIWVALSRRGSQAEASALRHWRDGDWRAVELGSVNSLNSLLPVPGGIIAGGFGGLWQVDTAEQLLDDFRAKPQRSGSRHISTDAARMLWLSRVSGEHGLILVDGGRWGRISTREGLLSDHPRATAHDDQGRVWVWFEGGQVSVYSRFDLIRRTHWAQASGGQVW